MRTSVVLYERLGEQKFGGTKSAGFGHGGYAIAKEVVRGLQGDQKSQRKVGGVEEGWGRDHIGNGESNQVTDVRVKVAGISFCRECPKIQREVEMHLLEERKETFAHNLALVVRA